MIKGFIIIHTSTEGKETILYRGDDNGEARKCYLQCEDIGSVRWFDLRKPYRNKINKESKLSPLPVNEMEKPKAVKKSIKSKTQD